MPAGKLCVIGGRYGCGGRGYADVVGIMRSWANLRGMTNSASIDPLFVGRVEELRWLERRLLSREHPHRPVFITGMGGVGKTSLIRAFLSSHPSHGLVRWADLYESANPTLGIEGFIRDLYAERPRGEVLVVVDGAEALTDTQIVEATGRFYNLKAVRSVVILSRRLPPPLDGRDSETLELGPLSASDTAHLLKTLSSSGVSPDVIEAAASATGGHPLAALVLAGILKQSPDLSLADVVRGPLYDVERAIRVPPSNIISVVWPTIAVASQGLVEALKRRPEAVYDLPPRKFEELIAELLTNMGWEVELTPATRDGGKDILAYLNTDLGRLLCLVEAKRYRRDHQVGVELVRGLYGTLCDHQANSAMLVTTSSFSRDAREFQKRHQYQLALRDYADIVTWLHRYKRVV